MWQEIAVLYNQFSAGLCKDMLDGLDLSWASLACIFVISIVIIVLNLLLARYSCNYVCIGWNFISICFYSRFVDYSLMTIVKFSLWDSGLRQMVCMCVCACVPVYVFV